MTADNSVKAIRGLTRALWALVVVMAIGIAAPFVWMLATPRSHTVIDGASSSTSIRDVPPEVLGGPNETYLSFADLSVEQKIAAASAILRTSIEAVDGKLVGAVEEVLLHRPGVELHFKVGDRWPPHEELARPNTSYGDGQLVFFRGSPAQMEYSVSFSDERITGLGHMPLEQFIALVEAAPSNAEATNHASARPRHDRQ